MDTVTRGPSYAVHGPACHTDGPVSCLRMIVYTQRSFPKSTGRKSLGTAPLFLSLWGWLPTASQHPPVLLLQAALSLAILTQTSKTQDCCLSFCLHDSYTEERPSACVSISLGLSFSIHKGKMKDGLSNAHSAELTVTCKVMYGTNQVHALGHHQNLS